MSQSDDKKLGMDRSITRRDFLNGLAVGAGGALAKSALPSLAFAGLEDAPSQDQPGYYPPALTGMRGSHPGSFEDAHAVRDGKFPPKNSAPADSKETYDLVIVGAGISGLAAAYFWRATEHNAKILILDNHDDFGGHAKRNEFTSGGRTLLGNGGTWAIESPFPYSHVARGLMDELTIDPDALAKKCYRPDVYQGLGHAVFFDQQTFGADRLVSHTPGGPYGGGGSAEDWRSYLEKTPLSPEVRRDMVRLETDSADYLPGLTSDQKKDKLTRISYKAFLLDFVKVNPAAVPYYQTRTHGLFGVGIDAVNALDCWALGQPGFKGLQLAPGAHPRMGYTPRGFATPKDPYEFHYPDGNATIARMLVRKLIPSSAPGSNAEDIVTAKFDYSQLDKSDSPVRIRLSSIVVSARHSGDPAQSKQVDVTYTRSGHLSTVHAKNVVMACWNMMIPYLCPDFPAPQKEALHYGVKIPIVYTAVAIRNWQAFHALGIHSVACPGMFHHQMNLDMPVDISTYQSAKTPTEPILVRMERTPCLPGLSERDQHRAGRGDLLSTSFATFERNIRDQFARVLGGAGFDPARDITAITVNRWPHGYAYEYNYLFDPEWPAGQSPCEIARKRFGRIAVANSDAGAAAYTDQAMDQAWRAVLDLRSM